MTNDEERAALLQRGRECCLEPFERLLEETLRESDFKRAEKGNRRPPPRRPASYADLLKLKAEAKNQGIMEAFIIFFSALRDKEGFGPTRLRRVLDAMNEYAGSIRNGYVTIQDLQTTLREEAGIELTFNSLGGGDK